MSEMINVGLLKPHPRNNEFFDDMTGEKWTKFLKSVETSGIIEPIVVTNDGDGYTIVSGHQRARACKELGLDNVECVVKKYENNDAILKDLLETNVCQRGNVGGAISKIGKIVTELDRIYENKVGGDRGNQYTGGKVATASMPTMTHKQMADRMGISLDELYRAKKLVNLPPEIQQMVDDGRISLSTASRCIASLSPSEQEQLISSLDVTAKYTQKQIESQLSSIRGQLEAAKQDNDMLKATNDNIRRKYHELEQRKPEVKEVIPDDYEYIKSHADALQNKLNEAALKIKRLEADAEQNKEDAEKHRALKKEIERLTTEKHSIALQIDASRELTALIRKIMQMIQEDLAPVKFSNAMDELGNNGGYIKAKLIGLLDTIEAWSLEVREAIEEKEIIDITERKEIVG